MSLLVGGTGSDTTATEDAADYWLFFDNSSVSNSAQVCNCLCPDNLLQKALSWSLRLFLSLARTYAALPILLWLLTLGLGFFLGIWASKYLPSIQATAAACMQRAVSFFQRQRQSSVMTLNKSQQVGSSNNERKDSSVATKATISSSSRETITTATPIPCCFDVSQFPQHIAIIMDGNRRYGKIKYNNALLGHSDGGKKLSQVCEWCLSYDTVRQLTVYCFSTENWNRDPAEIASLWDLMDQHSNDTLRRTALEKKISIRVHSTDPKLIPERNQRTFQQLERDTFLAQPRLILNLCVSYGSHAEIQQHFQHCKPLIDSPDLLLRTGGEKRLSNFLLHQLAYTELCFLDTFWPALSQSEFEGLLVDFAQRQRRFGK